MATAKPRTLSLAKRGLSFEIFMWFFTRLSALAMYALILAGLIGALIVSARVHANFADVLRWAFLPDTAANPLSTMAWAAVLVKLMVTAFVLVLSAHGVHGVLVILDDYFTSSAARRWFRYVVIAFFLVANAIVLYFLWTG